ncbi:hypothetical protein GCM10027275_07850 [Rhabdobacter roseus]|uniref:Rubredoxin n=1 Tax=Rhabdobacter roseus TaxID=1655419 RepID=A0A840TGT2_9BACT|nr:rubredoxin domain-containing protein [Rhabdobacter roseus]MBB5282684.1 rubredoxin [Rhabdobacter roseus]
MRNDPTLKINLPGGIVSAGTLRDILTAAQGAGVRQVRFGSRQQLLMKVPAEDLRFLERSLAAQQVPYELNADQHPNLISSYCAEEVFRTGQWLTESEYHTVLDRFDYAPRLKVNLSDSQQSFTPFFTGNLNFIASPEPHFWYLYVRPKQTNTVFRWRDLIYTNDLVRLARAVEAALLTQKYPDEDTLYAAVNQTSTFITQPATQEVELPDFSLPYYEGFNRYGSRTWLGLYRRNELFSVALLRDLCTLCLTTRVGELCVTPWKSLIIKGIEEKHREAWSQVLGRHNINVRHAANELAWQTEDHSDEGTSLKNDVLGYFQKHDTRTFGLCFGVQTRPRSEVFGSVLIRKRPLLRLGKYPLLSVYDLYHTEHFNPNRRKYLLFERGLWKIHLPGQLDRLCRKFNASRTDTHRVAQEAEVPPVGTLVASPGTYLTHQCPHCLTVYDATYGDALRQVPPGLAFAALPEHYTCPTCDAPKADFRPVTTGAGAVLQP